MVRSRWLGSHFIDCGTAPCTSATRRGAPRSAVHCMRLSAVPVPHTDSAITTATMRSRESPSSSATSTPAETAAARLTPYTPSTGAKPRSGVSSCV